MGRQTRRIYEFGPFRLIPEERQLMRDGQIVPITPKSFDLLVVLVENSGRLLEKSELMTRIWPDSFVEEANLSVKMSALRRALGEGPNEHQYVETVPRRGYRFVASVRERRDEELESPSREVDQEVCDNSLVSNAEPASAPPLGSPRDQALRARRWPLVLAGFLLPSALMLGLNAGGVRDRLVRNDNPEIRSLAVLPLENLSGGGEEDYFAEGMTEALITDLASTGALRVLSLQSVMKYKGLRASLAQIGSDLDVDAVVTGSALRSGERVRVAVQLFHAATGRQLWSESYERDLRDVLALRREVTRDIAGEIRINLTAQSSEQFAGVRPIDPEAWDHYLRGRFHLNRQNEGANDAAIMALERAVTADPDFAAAHAELAQAYVWKLFLFAPAEQQWEEKAFVSAEKALSLDPNSAVAYLARGRLLWTPANGFPHENAIREYRRALSLNPNLDEARNQLALVYCHIGAFDQALEQSHKAITTNPNNNLAQFRIGQTLNFQGKHDEALSVLRAIPQEVNPALVGYQIAWALFNLGRNDEASAMLEQLLRVNPADNGGLLTSVQAVLAASAGQKQTAEDKIRLAVEKGTGFGHFHHTAYHIACAHALMNQPDEAIKWLEEAAEDGFPCYPLFEKDANLDNLRHDARYVTFMAGLRQRWERYRKF